MGRSSEEQLLTPQQLHLWGQGKGWPSPRATTPGPLMGYPLSPLLSIFSPGLAAFPLFPGLTEAFEKPFLPFAPGASAKIHPFVNKISLK